MGKTAKTILEFDTRFTGKTEYRRLVNASLAGVLVTLGLPPFPWTGVLVPVGLAWFFAQLLAAEKPGRLAWAFGLAHQFTLQHWLFFLIPAKSIPTRALIPLQALAAILYVALFYWLFGWLVGRARRRLGLQRAVLLTPVLFVTMEILRDRGELAYPWCLAGSSVIGTPLMALARTSGEMGVGAAVAFTAAALAALVWSRPAWILLARTALAIWLVLSLGSLVGGGGPASEPVEVAAIQADVPLDEKWDPAKITATTVPYTDLTRQASADGARFIVWAETAIPAYVRYDKDLMDWVRDLAREETISIFTGFPDAQRRPDGELEKFNSSGLVNPQGVLMDRYPKHHLLPIGEAMPFTRYFPFLGGVDLGQAEWTPGPTPGVMTAVLGDRSFSFSAMICFESILGRLARQSVRQGSSCLLVITNDGWFGKTAGPRQHSAMARMRAAECGVPLIRCANNGISLITDDRGRVLDSLGLGKRGAVRAAITPGTGDTLFVRWGNLPLLVFLLLWTVAVLLFPLKGRADAPTSGK